MRRLTMTYWEEDLSSVFSTTTLGAYSSTYTPDGGSATTVLVSEEVESALTRDITLGGF